jgi:hypothetical protein
MRTIITALLLLASVPLLATPSGLTWIPNTDTQPSHVWHLDSDSYAYNSGVNGAPAPAAFIEEGVLYGVNSRVEAGVDIANGFANAEGVENSPVFFNAKYQAITPSAKVPVAFSVGAFDVSPEKAANAQLLYAVAAYSLKNTTRFTVGGYEGKKSVISTDSAGQDFGNSGVLLGVDRSLGKWWVTADYQSGSNTFGSVNAGAGYNLTPKLLVFVGYDHYNNPTLVGSRSSENVQIDINL